MRFVCGLLVAAVLAACSAKGQEITILSSPYLDEAEHKEPVFFTGRHYQVTFKFSKARLAYEMRVEGQGWALTGLSDQSTAQQVAASALSHFACPTKQPAGIVKGTARYSDGAWRMEARCGS